MGKGDAKRRTTKSKTKAKRKGRGVNLFADVKRPAWKKPPVERLYDKGYLDDTELWAARRFAAGFMALVAPMQPHSVGLDRVDGMPGIGAASATHDLLERATLADDYKTAALAMDRHDVAEGRFRGYTREIALAVCACDMPLTVIEERWHLGHGTAGRDLKRALRIYALVIDPPAKEHTEPAYPPVEYGLSTRV